jgi:hypothetical protein
MCAFLFDELGDPWEVVRMDVAWGVVLGGSVICGGGTGEVGGDDLEGSFPVALGGCLGVGEGPKEFMGRRTLVCLRFSSWVMVVTPNSCSSLRGFLMGARLGWASGVPRSAWVMVSSGMGNGGSPSCHMYMSRM